MALMFSRLAHNFIKNGYFPTDDRTVAGILSAIDIGAQSIRILDPCCGEGCALAEVKRHLTECGASVSALGVEFDPERAWHAKTLLDSALHADIHDVMISQRSTGLLFLNPPYGDVVSDKAGTGSRKKADRLEKVFFRRTMPLLQFGGVLVLIVPYYIMDAEFANMIARNFERVAIYKAPEQKFKQCVIFGVKRRSDTPDGALVSRLEAAKDPDKLPELPDVWIDEPYLVPGINGADSFSFCSVRIDAPQLGAEIKRLERSTLWPRFGMQFERLTQAPRRPLRDLSRWHLGLALAAGQINGLVSSKDGRQFLIKGDTFKEKAKKVEHAEGPDGGVIETTIMTDKFVPTIKGIDFTPGLSFGDVMTIK
jgi:Uncharacterised methyltransferase family (DUF6094)